MSFILSYSYIFLSIFMFSLGPSFQVSFSYSKSHFLLFTEFLSFIYDILIFFAILVMNDYGLGLFWHFLH